MTPETKRLHPAPAMPEANKKEKLDPREAKLEKTRGFMREHDVQGVWFTSPPNVRYISEFHGMVLEDRESSVVVLRDSPKQILLATGNHPDQIKATQPLFEYRYVSDENQTKLAEELVAQGIKTIGIEGDHMIVNEYHMLLNAGLEPKIVPAEKLRTIKTPEEIEAIQRACDASDKIFQQTLPHLKEGITEIEVRNLMVQQMKELGFQQEAFATIVAFGPNAANPHSVPTDTPLGRNQFVLMDYGVQDENGYRSDISRTVFVGKKEDLTPEQIKMYLTANKAIQEAIAYISSISAEDISQGKLNGFDIDHAAREYIYSQGYSFENFPHSLGHGLGIQDHEYPLISFRAHHMLEEGMVVAIEPGVYIEGVGGVRIEDNILITAQGPQLLTHSPRDLICIDPQSGEQTILSLEDLSSLRINKTD